MKLDKLLEDFADRFLHICYRFLERDMRIELFNQRVYMIGWPF